MSIQENQETQQPSKDGCLPALFRLFWLLFGNVVLLFLTAFIAIRKFGIIADASFWLIVAVLILVRYIDITHFEGQTGECEPATIKHWHRYSLSLLVIAVLLYALARILAHFRLL